MDISCVLNMAAKTVSSLLSIKYNLRLVYQHAVRSVNPFNLIEKELKCANNVLSVGNKTYKLENNVYLVGFGKAVLGMGYQSELILGNHLKSGILSIPVGQKDMFSLYSFKTDSAIKIFEGAENNIPDLNAEISAKHIVNLVKDLTEKDILLVLISGGGSALLPLPIPPVTLEDKINVIKLLQQSGADILELNTVRKQLSLVKGGGLLELAYPAQVIAFILSDIIGDPLDLIASAPTVVNQDNREKAKTIFEKYSLLNKIPESVKQVIDNPMKINDTEAIVQNILIGTNSIALKAAAEEAVRLDYNVFILTDVLEGLVSDIYVCYIEFIKCICNGLSGNISRNEFLDKLQSYKNKLKVHDKAFLSLVDIIYTTNPDKLCLLFGGEPTVKITGSGKGGRSQQLSLQFSDALNKVYSEHKYLENFNVGLLCGGTDGIDGPTDVAGALAYNSQLEKAYKQNLDPVTYIQNCDAYTFFSKLDNGEDLLKVGHTGTNVMDIHILLIERIKQ